MAYYSVDRRGAYAEGAELTLQLPLDAQGNLIVEHINTMYPNGFSRHGMQWFRDPGPTERKPDDTTSGVLELLLEAVRKAHYPDRPCRYQSVVAWNDEEAAHRFRAAHGKPDHPIHELHPLAGCHRGDMSLLVIGDSFAAIDHRMHLYWQGETLSHAGHVTTWEHLLPLPVRVGRRVA
nr:hypothetical protein [Variovorax boronicumulans]